VLTCVCTFIDASVDGPVLCGRRCRRQKSCRRHKCTEVCCVDDEHICTQTCARQLDCGIHTCEQLCHPGPCQRCLQADFTEQYCLCGASVRAPPIACGTPLPVCLETCTRTHACAHPVRHRCHAEVSCPPCTQLVTVWCYGKHEVSSVLHVHMYTLAQMRANIPCHLGSVSCGRRCDRPLPCGVHKCDRMCHADECVPLGAQCTQPCARQSRLTCPHACAAACHAGTECPAPGECKVNVTATCACGMITDVMPCVKIDRLRLRQQLVRSCAPICFVLFAQSNKQLPAAAMSEADRVRCLSCDDNCARLRRNREFARALNIQLEASTGNPVSSSDSPVIYTEYLRTFARSQPKFAAVVQVCARLIHT
jgi:transcriptional repressor NF-X1